MQKKLFFLFTFFVFSNIFSFNEYKAISQTNQDNATKYLHINLNCKGCLTQRRTNAGCAIFKDNKVLMVKHKFTGKWGFPGGTNRLNGELAFQTAYRETLEETGYIVAIEDFIVEFNNNFRLFKCSILKDTKKTDFFEIGEEKFFSKEEIADMMKNNRKSLRYEHEFDVLYPKWDYLQK